MSKKIEIKKHNTKIKNLLDDDDSEEYAIDVQQTVLNNYVVDFPRVIESDFHKYTSLFKLFRDAKEVDSIIINIGCQGGSCLAGNMLGHMIKSCNAYTKVVVSSNCYSAGSLLAVCGDELQMLPATLLMFHNYNNVESGKGAELLMSVAQSDRNLHTQDRHFAHPFLTKSELDNLWEDKDIYIHADDKSLKKRCLRHFPSMKRAEKEAKKKKK
jgi:ATP-dependent protease ClpP protease subunit